MNLSDKLGELDSAFGWQLNKLPNDRFSITIWTKNQLGDGPSCSFKTKVHANLYSAVDEAIDMFREHMSDCSLC